MTKKEELGIASEQPAGSDAPQQLSKRQQKKMARKQRQKEIYQHRKQQEKEERAQAGETKKRQISEMLEGMSEEDRQAWIKQQQDKKRARYEERLLKKEKLQQALETGLKIAIDLDFEEYMADDTLASLCKQLSYSYSAVQNSQKPPHLHLISLQTQIRQHLERSHSGYKNWKATTISEKSLMDYFQGQKIDVKNKLIYLTGDAGEEMCDIEEDAVYIIGGIIDSNRFKNLCKDKAEKMGIRTAALPLDKYLQFSGSKILTVNQVVQILTKFNETRDWSQVLHEVIPNRKITSKEQQSLNIEQEKNSCAEEQQSLTIEQAKNSHAEEQQNSKAGEQNLHINGEQSLAAKQQQILNPIEDQNLSKDCVD